MTGEDEELANDISGGHRIGARGYDRHCVVTIAW